MGDNPQESKEVRAMFICFRPDDGILEWKEIELKILSRAGKVPLNEYSVYNSK